MREIKFRGKDLDGDGWVYGSLVKEVCGDVWIFPHGDTYCNAGGDWYCRKRPGFCVVDPKTVGQYTGLKDKNGKEIYEGDVVRDYEGVIHYVRWSVGDGCFDFTGSPYTLSDDCEVIGNIYDSPELLKQREQKQGEL